jgi:hypothetical protein
MSLPGIIAQLRTGQADFNDVADGLEILGQFQSWSPTVTTDSNLVVSITNPFYRFKAANKEISVIIRFNFEVISGSGVWIGFSLPVAAAQQNVGGGAFLQQSGLTLPGSWRFTSNQARFRNANNTNIEGSSTRICSASFKYEAA